MKLQAWFAIALLAACGDDPSTITLTSVEVPSGESGDVIVTAQRSGGEGAVSISFRTRDDSAVDADDYVGSTGKLEWADGDMEDKTIVIPIVDDVTVESEESFVIELVPKGGVELGESSVTATITDDDGPGDSFAVTSTGRLMHFNRADAGRFSLAVDVTGLAGSEKAVALDYRPADGKLYALTDGAKLYTVDPTTGAATPVSTLAAAPGDTTSPYTGLTGTQLAMDFNPVTDELRVVSETGQNLRINADTGAVTTDPMINGMSMGYGAIAHNNNVAAACRTTLYAIDVATNRFLTQTPNTGNAIGVGGLGMDATASAGFDVVTDAAGASSGLAFLAVAGQMSAYTIELSSGNATLARKVGPLAEGEEVLSFAIPSLDPASPTTQQPGELYAVTATDILSFNRAAPAKQCTIKPLNGLAAGENVVALDIRPSNGILYVLTNTNGAGKLRRVDPMSGNLAPAIPISVPLQGTDFGMDFNPTGTVPLRIVSNTGQNIRVTDLMTGAATADTPLNGAGTSATGAAYTDAVQGAGTTTLYVIDSATDRLRVQNPPNAGTLTDVGALGIDVANVAGFDIDGRDNTGFVVATTAQGSQLYTINLTTGALSASQGTIGGGTVLGVARVTPTTNVFGITTDNKLVRISLNDPSMVTVISDPELMPPVDTITGLAAGEHLIGIDVRSGGAIMYGLGSNGGIYSVNGSVARANLLGTLTADPMDASSPFSMLSGTSFGFDFDPTNNVPLRIVSNGEQNLRVPDVSMPRAITDAPLNPSSLEVTAAAYTNNIAGATSTTLYVIDIASGSLMIQNPPNSGTLTPVGLLGITGLAGTATGSGFDIAGGNNGVVLATFQKPAESFSRLYRVDLTTGAATEIGTGIGGMPLRGLTIQIR